MTSSSGTNRNKFYAPKLLEKILKHYIAYLPFWTIFVSRQQDPSATRNNNARVERYFCVMKNDCDKEHLLPRLGSIKPKPYAAFRSCTLGCLLNEIDYEYGVTPPPTSEDSNVDLEESSLSQQQEQWDKKRRTTFADFSRKRLMTEFAGEKK